MKKAHVTAHDDQPVYRQAFYEDSATIRARLAERTRDLRTCACGQPATQLVCGPPTRAQCRGCFDQDMQEIAQRPRPWEPR